MVEEERESLAVKKGGEGEIENVSRNMVAAVYQLQDCGAPLLSAFLVSQQLEEQRSTAVTSANNQVEKSFRREQQNRWCGIRVGGGNKDGLPCRRHTNVDAKQDGKCNNNKKNWAEN